MTGEGSSHPKMSPYVVFNFWVKMSKWASCDRYKKDSMNANLHDKLEKMFFGLC
jgi:hypothetical protein